MWTQVVRQLRRIIGRWLDLAMDALAVALRLGRSLDALILAEDPEARSLCSSVAKNDWACLLYFLRRITGPADRLLKHGALRKLAVDSRQLRFK